MSLAITLFSAESEFSVFFHHDNASEWIYEQMYSTEPRELWIMLPRGGGDENYQPHVPLAHRFAV